MAFDIETYADFAGLPASTRAYLTRRDEARGIGPRDRRAVGNKAALLPGVAQVIAIGLWGALDGAERLSLSLVPDLASERAEAFGEGGVRLLRFRQEADLLEAFWQRCEAALRSGRRLVSFHGRSFDGPILALRSQGKNRHGSRCQSVLGAHRRGLAEIATEVGGGRLPPPFRAALAQMVGDIDMKKKNK